MPITKKSTKDVLDATLRELNGNASNEDRHLIEAWQSAPVQPAHKMTEAELLNRENTFREARRDLRALQAQINALPKSSAAKPVVKNAAKPIEMREVTPQALNELTRLVEEL